MLLHKKKHAYRLDGDNIRMGLNKNLGFSAEDRAENIRRIGEVAKLFTDAGVIAITSFISPYKKDRDAVRASNKPGEFIEVYVNVSLEAAEKRDPKGLYKKARAGQIKGFTGIDDPYEAPEKAEIVIDTETTSACRCGSADTRLSGKGRLSDGVGGCSRPAAGPPCLASPEAIAGETPVPTAMSFVDLHCHSTASDGTFAPAEVVALAVRSGLTRAGPDRSRHHRRRP